MCLPGRRPRRRPRKLVPSGGAGRTRRPRSGCEPAAAIPPTVEGICARGPGPHPWSGFPPVPGSAPSPPGSWRAGVVPPGSAGAPLAGHRGAWVSHKTPHWIASEFGTFKFSNSYVSRASALRGSRAPRDPPPLSPPPPLRLLRRPWLPRPRRPGLPCPSGRPGKVTSKVVIHSGVLRQAVDARCSRGACLF